MSTTGSDANAYDLQHRDAFIRESALRKTDGATAAFTAECDSMMERLSVTACYSEDHEEFVQNVVASVKDRGIVCQWDDVEYLVFINGVKKVPAICRGELLMISSACGGYDIRAHSRSENAENVVFGGKQLNDVQDVAPLWSLKEEQVIRAVVQTSLFLDALNEYWTKGGKFPFDFLTPRGWVQGLRIGDLAGSQQRALVGRRDDNGGQLSQMR